MKKKVLSVLLSFALCLTLMPETMFTEAAGGYTEAPAVSGNVSAGSSAGSGNEAGSGAGNGEAGSGAGNGEAGSSEGNGEAGSGAGNGEAEAGSSAGNGNEAGSGEGSGGEGTETAVSGNAAEQNEKTAAVQALIDALPSLAELEAADAQTQQEIYEALQEAYDAYEALSAQEQALLTGADCFETLFGWFNAQVSPLEETTTHTTHCVCGADHQEIGDHTTAETITWTPIGDVTNETGDGEPDGKYTLADITQTVTNAKEVVSEGDTIYLYLTEDFELNSGWKIDDNIALCLNGHKLTGETTGAVIDVSSWTARTFILTDCGGTGKITHAAKVNGSGIVLSNAAHTFKMYGGSITGNTANNSEGGGVNLEKASLSMYGGSITKNTAKGSTGGGVYLEKASLSMYGGSITENTADLEGGGVYLKGNSNFHMYGGSITDNTAGSTGGGVAVMNVYESCVLEVDKTAEISGNTSGSDTPLVASNFFLSKDALSKNQKLTVQAEFSGTVGLTAEDGEGQQVIDRKGTGGTVTSDDSGYKIDDGGMLLSACEHVLGDDGCCTACQKQLQALVTKGETTTYSPSLLAAINMAEEGATVTVLCDGTTLSNSVEITKGITLDLNGKTVTMSGTDASLKIYAAGVIIQSSGENGALGKLVRPKSSSGTAVVEATVNIGSSSSQTGQTGSLTLTGGALGALYIYRGTFCMTGGSITQLQGKGSASDWASLSGGTIQTSISLISQMKTIGSLPASGCLFQKTTVEGETTKSEYLTDTELNGRTLSGSGPYVIVPSPLTSVTLTPSAGSVLYCSSMKPTVTAAVTAAGEIDEKDLTYTWYLDDVQDTKQTGKTYTFSTDQNVKRGYNSENQLVPSPYKIKCLVKYGEIVQTAETGITVTPMDLSSEEISVTINGGKTFTYEPDGIGIPVEKIVVKQGEKTLEYNTDYRVTDVYANAAGTHVVTIDVKDGSKGNYKGERRATCVISPKTLVVDAESIKTNPASYVYSPYTSAYTPEVTVYDGEYVVDSSEYTVSFSNNTAAGTATVTITDVAGGNYVISGSGTFEIQKQAISASCVGYHDYDYGGVPFTPSVTDNPGGGTVTYYYNTTESYAGATEWKDMTGTGLNAGEYYLFAVMAESKNYGSCTTPIVKFTVNRADAPVEAWPKVEKFYVGDTLKDSDLKGGSSSVSGSFKVTGETTSWQTIGSQTAEVRFVPEDSNYNTVKNSVSVNVMRRIVKSAAAQTAITDQPFGTALEALGLPEKVSITTEDGKTYENIPVTWSGYNAQTLETQTLTGSLNLTDIANLVEQPTVGSTQPTAGSTQPVTASIQVTLRPLTAVAPTFADGNATYDGAAKSLALAAADIPVGVTAVTYSYRGTDGTDYEESETAPTNAGSYTVTASFTMQYGYAPLSSVTATLKIAKAEPAATVVMENYAYESTPSVPGLTGSYGNGSVTYYYNATDSNTGGTEWKNMTGTTLQKGDYYLYAVIAESANYQAYTTAPVGFTVENAAAPVSAWAEIIGNVYVGDTLTDSALSGGIGGIAGSFSITGVKSWARSGEQTTAITFTPEDLTNYSAVTKKDVAVNVVKRTVASAAEQTAITDKPFGTALEELGLPETVNITTADGKTYENIPVAWSGYDAQTLETQTLTGSLNLTDIAAEVEQPTAGNAQPTAGNAQPTAGNAQPTAGNAQPTAGNAQPTAGNAQPVTAEIQVTLQPLTAKQPAQSAFPDKTVTYDGAAKSLALAETAVPVGVEAVSYSYEGTDGTGYEASGTAPVNAGSYTVTADFTMQYGYSPLDAMTAKLTIERRDIAGADITLGAALTANGEQQTQTLASVKLGSLTLTAEDYELSGNTAGEAGEYTLTIRGKGNYSGEATKSWSIAAAEESGGSGEGSDGTGGSGSGEGSGSTGGNEESSTGGTGGSTGGSGSSEGSGSTGGSTGGTGSGEGSGSTGTAPISYSWPNVDALLQDISRALQQIGNSIGGAGQESRNINVQLPGENQVPAYVLHTLSGTQLTLALQQGNGVALSIRGEALNETNLSGLLTLDLTTDTDTAAIPAEAIQGRQTAGSRQLSIRDTGRFAVPVGLHVGMGAENAGRFANFYRYNEAQDRLEYCGSFRITGNGQAMLALKQGGSYFINVTDVKPVEKYLFLADAYTVRRGDTLSRIARRYRMTLAELLQKNPTLRNANRIRVGQKINVN